MSQATVFVVDDDPAFARSLCWLIESVRLRVEMHPSAQAFLDVFDPARPGCLLLDVRMPGMSGIELQQRLAARGGYHLPIVFVTGHGDVQMAVRAVQAGAFDFVEKPFNDQDLLDRVQRAIAHDGVQRERARGREALRTLFDALTPREREVLDLVVQGQSNKAIAIALGVSAKTVEFHRARLMDKLRARSVTDLVKLAVRHREDA